MNSLDSFRMGDSLWAYLLSTCNNRCELEKRQDLAAELWENDFPDCEPDEHYL